MTLSIFAIKFIDCQKLFELHLKKREREKEKKETSAETKMCESFYCLLLFQFIELNENENEKEANAIVNIFYAHSVNVILIHFFYSFFGVYKVLYFAKVFKH